MSRNWNNCVLRKKSIVCFDLIKKHNSYLWLIFCCFDVTQFNVFFVSSVKIKYDDSKRPKKGLQEKNHLWVLIRSKTTVLTYVFFNSVWLNLMYCYFLSIKIKVMKVKTKIFFHENNFNRDFIQSKMLVNSG